MDSELIASFCSITGSTPSTAEYYLNAANGDLDMGIGLFYEAGGREAGDKEREMQSVPLVMDVDVADKDVVDKDIVDKDVVEILPSGSRASTSASSTSRANITHPLSSTNTSSTRNIFMPPTQPVVQVINDSDSDSDSEEQVQAFTQQSQASQRSRAQRLADLFKSPHEIMFPGTFDSARRYARDHNRWLLVTLHCPTEFSCQAMNRDCWNDPGLQEFIRENLVFLQLQEGTPDAARYANFYPFDGLMPHVAIIDPRTGERVKTLLLATIPVPGFRVIGGAGEMLEELVAFTCDHLLDSEAGVGKEPYSAVVEKESSGSSAVGSAMGGTRGSSTASASASINITNPSIRSTTTSPSTTTPYTTTTTPSNNLTQDRPVSPSAGKKAKVNFQMPPEPDSSIPNCTTIQFRLPDGSKLKRRFTLAAHVDEVFRVAEAACGLERNEFELRRAGEGSLEVDDQRCVGEVPGLRSSVITIVQK